MRDSDVRLGDTPKLSRPLGGFVLFAGVKELAKPALFEGPAHMQVSLGAWEVMYGDGNGCALGQCCQ